jgi:hypothetical protein
MSANLKRKAPEEDKPVKKVAPKDYADDSEGEDSDDGLQVIYTWYFTRSKV